jgi:site-specific recombinase XerD
MTNEAVDIPPLVKKTLDMATATSVRSAPISKTHLTKEEMIQIGRRVQEKKDDVKWVRDWALTLIMYHGLLRESEAVALELQDVKMIMSEQRMDLRINKDKTSNRKIKKGLPPGRTVTILKDTNREVCAISWMEMYLGMRKLTSQPHLFQSVNDTSKKLSTATPNHIVKRLVALIQRDPKDYGSHSLRSGATTEAIQRGVSKDDVRKQGGWSVNSATIEKYIRDDEQARVRTAKALTS